MISSKGLRWTPNGPELEINEAAHYPLIVVRRQSISEPLDGVAPKFIT
jgi:hypothetical protein